MKKEVTLQESLITDLRTLINEARNKVALIVNTEITLLYWHIGKRINEEVLGNQRAEYGKQIVSTVSTQLTKEYGRGFELRNLRRMMQFAELFPDFQIVAPLARQLSWSHFIELLSIKNDLGREFYLTMAASENWSIRTLRNKIDSMLYERTAISSKPEEVIKTELANLRDNEILSPDLVFKSPYFFGIYRT